MRTRIEAATQRLLATRGFVKKYFQDLSESDWHWQPAPGINNLAWQVGHLAFAEYALCLRRQRGVLPSDEAFMPAAFFERYRRESLPSNDPAENYPPEELLRILDAVREQVLVELAGWTDEDRSVPTEPPHPMFTTKIGAIEWSNQHELMHCGQIVLLRRLLGKPASW
jgi:hypothetical protein